MLAAVSINQREDGRIEVVDNGLVIYCGHRIEVARAIAKSRRHRLPEGAIYRRDESDQWLPDAIERARRGQ